MTFSTGALTRTSDGPPPAVAELNQKGTRFSRALFLAALSFIYPPAQAHVDTILTVSEDGSIAELPKAYADARLHIEISGPRQTKNFLRLKVGNQEYRLPACALAPVKTRRRNAVEVTGSWYHDDMLPGLPHYLLVRFPDPVQPKRAIHPIGVEYLLNLQTPGLIDIKRVVYEGRRSIRFQPLSLQSLCGGAKP